MSSLTFADLDRLFSDPNSLVSRFGHDSRSNQTLSVDPKGNSTIVAYDGASRATQVQEHLREQGQGENPPAPNETLLPYGGATIRSVTSFYDGNSRLTLLVDDNGNPTSYAYDTLDRQTTMTFQDTSTRQYVYDQASDVTSYTDENGSVFVNTFDPLGRKTNCAITPAAGVAGHNGDGTRGTVEQAIEYDGASRLTKSTDTTQVNNASSEAADVELFYDSLSRLLEDAQTFASNTREATNTKFISYPMTECAYPDGRNIENTFDILYRKTLCHDSGGAGTDIASWEYQGPGRVAECTLGNGLIQTQLNNARTNSAVQTNVANPAWGDQSSDRLGYDGAGRLITKRYLAGGINGGTHAYNNTSSVVGQTTAYDKSSNKLFERALQAESRSSLYETTATQMLIDDFTSTADNGTVGLVAPPTTPNVQNGGLGNSVIGGGTTQRTTTLTRTGGVGSFLTGSINPTAQRLRANSPGGGVVGTLSAQYNSNMNAGGLSANLAGFLGVSVDVLAFSPGTDVSSSATVTLTDGSGNPAAVGMGVITAAGKLIIPSSAFTNLGTLDLSNIDDILVVFNVGNGQEFSLGSVSAQIATNHVTGGYDSLDRLRQYQRGTLATGGESIAQPITLPNTDESRDYDLDGLGNWRRTNFEPVGGSEATQIRQHNGLNEITSTDDGSTKDAFSYDGVVGASNGNLVDDGTRTYAWDALNRLKQISKTPDTPVQVGEYVYDALGRRIRKVITNGGLSGNITNGTTDYLYHSGIAQCCEERDGSNNPQRQYVWGHYIDELLQQKTDISGTPTDQYPLQDTLYRTLALTDDIGAIVETYDYDAYGNTLIFMAAGTGGNWWADDATQGDEPTCDFLFTGRRFDAESEIYFYRARYYVPRQGRFISRDPIGYEDGYSLYAYVNGSPLAGLDPTGLKEGCGTKDRLTKYFSRWKDGKRWRDGANYEVSFQQVTVMIDATRCCCGEGFAMMSLRSEITRPYHFGTALTARITDSGFYLPSGSFFKAHFLKDAAPDKPGGESYVIFLKDIIKLKCDGTDTQVLYYSLPPKPGEKPDLQLHHKITIDVAIADSGNDIKIDFGMTMGNPKVAAGQGKFLTELTGPKDPRRASLE